MSTTVKQRKRAVCLHEWKGYAGPVEHNGTLYALPLTKRLWVCGKCGKVEVRSEEA